MIAGNFLAVNKEHFGSGLDSCEILILSHIEEFERNGCLCYLTNEQMSEMFGETVSKIKRRIDVLEEKGVIQRETVFVSELNRKKRVLISNYESRTKESTKNGVEQVQNRICSGSNDAGLRFKTNLEEVHSEPIKENLKENLKDNLKDNDNMNQDSENRFDNSFKKKRKKYRTIQELEIEEGNDISDSVKYGLETYVNLQQRYNLEFGSVTKEFIKQWKEEKSRRGGAIPNKSTDGNDLLLSNRKQNKEWIGSIMEGMGRTDDDTAHEQYEYEQDELEWDDDL